jgi:ABC-2 type transport system ATP-binding protein
MVERQIGPVNAIEVGGLTKSFGDVTAVDDLSFDIPIGRVTGFLGPNGAGKSTTLRMVLGLIRPDGGETAILGQPYAALEEPARSVGALLDVEQFHPQRSGRNHLRVVATAAGIARERVEEVLGLVDLAHAAGRKVGGYSLGMRQRLGLATALLGDPRVLVLDEPANGLDPAGMRWLRDLLRGFASDGRAVFVSSHLLAQMADIAEDVVVINRGRLVTHAAIADLLDRTGGTARVTTPEPERLSDVLTAQGLGLQRVSPDTLRVEARPDVVGLAAAGAGIPLFGLVEEDRSLEDAFFDLTKSGERSA